MTRRILGVSSEFKMFDNKIVFFANAKQEFANFAREADETGAGAILYHVIGININKHFYFIMVFTKSITSSSLPTTEHHMIAEDAGVMCLQQSSASEDCVGNVGRSWVVIP